MLEGLVGGWRLTAINTMTSGLPVNLSYSPSSTFQVSGVPTYRPNLIGDVYGDRERSTTTSTRDNVVDPDRPHAAVRQRAAQRRARAGDLLARPRPAQERRARRRPDAARVPHRGVQRAEQDQLRRAERQPLVDRLRHDHDALDDAAADSAGGQGRLLKTMVHMRTGVVIIALGVVCAPLGVHGLIERPAQVGAASQTTPPSKRMQDGRQWSTTNLDVDIDGSYCYGDAPANCRRYGRLYTWEAAQKGCLSLGEGWRLPTNDEWRLLATRYGGLRQESEDMGRSGVHRSLDRRQFRLRRPARRRPRGDQRRIRAARSPRLLLDSVRDRCVHCVALQLRQRGTRRQPPQRDCEAVGRFGSVYQECRLTPASVRATRPARPSPNAPWRGSSPSPSSGSRRRCGSSSRG